MSKMRKPGIVFQPRANQSIKCGIQKLAQLISPTLGPVPRVVVYQKHADIEFLDKGAIIARRMTDLPNRHEDVGAMYLRHMIWQLYEAVGDGTATATVLFKTLYEEGLRAIAAGAEPAKLKHFLESSLKLMLEHLDSITCKATQMQEIAKSVCSDETLSKLLGEIIKILGSFGKLELRKGGTEHHWTFIEGNYWSGGVLSKRMLEGKPESRVELEDVGILVTDADFDDPRDLPPILKVAMAAGFEKMVLIAKKVSEPVVTFLKSPQLIKQIEVLPVKLDGITQAQSSANQSDITTLVGGYPVLTLGQKKPLHVSADDFGRARLVWADLHHVGIISGQGNPLELAAHTESLKAAFLKSDDAELRKTLRKRIGNLLGGAITLWVGGATDREVDKNKEIADHASITLRDTLEHGILAGGGTALLSCRDLLCQRYKESETFEERLSCQLLIKAIEAPLRCMLQNAGLESNDIFAKLQKLNVNMGFDIRNEKFVNMYEAGIVDVATVQKAALRYAVKSVALALTIQAVIFKKNPPRATNP